jgi:hypothetical protein
VSRNLNRATVVVDTPLNPAMYAADREPVGLVKVSDRLVVLTLSVLDHEPVSGVIGVDRQGTPATIAARVAPEPVKTMLASCSLPENRVA